VGGNYAPSIAPAVAAAQKGCAQVLWLYPEGDDHLVTEVRLETNPHKKTAFCGLF
jgi:hypothetical protein